MSSVTNGWHRLQMLAYKKILFYFQSGDVMFLQIRIISTFHFGQVGKQLDVQVFSQLGYFILFTLNIVSCKTKYKLHSSIPHSSWALQSPYYKVMDDSPVLYLERNTDKYKLRFSFFKSKGSMRKSFLSNNVCVTVTMPTIVAIFSKPPIIHLKIPHSVEIGNFTVIHC